MSVSGYPDDYRDPEWDGSFEQFRDVVIPARLKAIARSINERVVDALPDDIKFELSPEISGYSNG